MLRFFAKSSMEGSGSVCSLQGSLHGLQFILKEKRSPKRLRTNEILKQSTVASNMAVSQGKKRIQLDFTPDQVRQLKRLKQTTGAGSFAEVLRNALRLYRWFLRQQKSGWTVVLVKGDVEKEVELLF